MAWKLSSHMYDYHGVISRMSHLWGLNILLHLPANYIRCLVKLLFISKLPMHLMLNIGWIYSYKLSYKTGKYCLMIYIYVYRFPSHIKSCDFYICYIYISCVCSDLSLKCHFNTNLQTRDDGIILVSSSINIKLLYIVPSIPKCISVSPLSRGQTLFKILTKNAP